MTAFSILIFDNVIPDVVFVLISYKFYVLGIQHFAVHLYVFDVTRAYVCQEFHLLILFSVMKIDLIVSCYAYFKAFFIWSVNLRPIYCYFYTNCKINSLNPFTPISSSAL